MSAASSLMSCRQGRAYNATIAGTALDTETWLGWGTQMINAACAAG